MAETTRPLAAALGCLALAAGCASAPRPVPAPPPPAPEAAATLPPVPPPRDPPASGGWEPVYRNPKIGRVMLRAHQDAEGRLLGPQVMYQVIDPGGWNLEAAERGGGYIPAANLEVPPSLGSPYTVPAREVPPLPPGTPLLDPALAERIVITGRMREDQGEEAGALARARGEGWAAVFDPQAGWLLLPPEAKAGG